MNFFKKYTTPFGYVADGNMVDAYGVDHSAFSTRDELEYQFARTKRENQLANSLGQQGIERQDYPRLGTAFWGNSPENNYGFGSSNISANIENMKNKTPAPWARRISISENNYPLNQGKPVYQNPQPKGYSIGDIALEGIKGFEQGVVGGIEHGINGLSMGLYDAINDAFFNEGYEKRQKELEKLAEDVNLGKAYKYANYAIDIGLNGLLGTGGTKKAKRLLNKIKKRF